MKGFFCRWLTLITGVSSLVLVSCDSESSQIGSDFFRSGSLDVSSIDTVQVKLSTITFDSLITNESVRLLVGSYTDDKLGKIAATAFFKPDLNTSAVIPSNNVSYDGVSVVLRYDGYSWYDTTLSHTIQVHQLQDEMEVADDGKLYNSSYFPISKTPLGTLTFLPNPHRRDSIELLLDDTFGQDLFNKAQNKTQEFVDSEDFQRFIRGFALVPDTSRASAIVGVRPSPELRIYYRDLNVIPAERKYVAYTASGALTSTAISADRRQTKISMLSGSRSRWPSAQSDEQAYLQAGTGLALRLELPYLRNLHQLSNFYPTSMVLQIEPVRKSYDDFTPLPDTLDVFIVDHKNSSLGEYSYDAYLREDFSTGRDTHYELDATAFIKSQMDLAETNENALVFLLPDKNFRVTTNRIYFAAPPGSYQTRLIIYYATILNQ